MAQPVLSINQHIEAIFVEQRTATLSLAVSLHDDFREGKPVTGRIYISLKEEGQTAIQNLSGYHCFTDVAPGTYTISVTSDHYFDTEQEVALPLADPKQPVTSITLKPIPSYPFPPGATLIKGGAEDVHEQPVAGATVRVLRTDIENQTTVKGEFVLYFTGLTEDDVKVVDGKRLVQVHGSTDIVLEITHLHYKRKRVHLEVEEGQITSVLITDIES